MSKTNLSIWEKRAIAEHLRWYKDVTMIKLNKRQTAFKNSTGDWYIVEQEKVSQGFHEVAIKVSQDPVILNTAENFKEK